MDSEQRKPESKIPAQQHERPCAPAETCRATPDLTLKFAATCGDITKICEWVSYFTRMTKGGSLSKSGRKHLETCEHTQF